MLFFVLEPPVGHLPLSRNSAADSGGAEISPPKKLNGSSAEIPSYQNLHRELLLSHKRLVKHWFTLSLDRRFFFEA